MRIRLEAILPRIYGLVLTVSMLLLPVLLSGCSPKKAFLF